MSENEGRRQFLKSALLGAGTGLVVASNAAEAGIESSIETFEKASNINPNAKSMSKEDRSHELDQIDDDHTYLALKIDNHDLFSINADLDPEATKLAIRAFKKEGTIPTLESLLKPNMDPENTKNPHKIRYFSQAKKDKTLQVEFSTGRGYDQITIQKNGHPILNVKGGDAPQAHVEFLQKYWEDGEFPSAENTLVFSENMHGMTMISDDGKKTTSFVQMDSEDRNLTLKTQDNHNPIFEIHGKISQQDCIDIMHAYRENGALPAFDHEIFKAKDINYIHYSGKKGSNSFDLTTKHHHAKLTLNKHSKFVFDASGVDVSLAMHAIKNFTETGALPEHGDELYKSGLTSLHKVSNDLQREIYIKHPRDGESGLMLKKLDNNGNRSNFFKVAGDFSFDKISQDTDQFLANGKTIGFDHDIFLENSMTYLYLKSKDERREAEFKIDHETDEHIVTRTTNGSAARPDKGEFSKSDIIRHIRSFVENNQLIALTNKASNVPSLDGN